MTQLIRGYSFPNFRFFREYVRIAKEKGVINIPTYSWFLLQFWPTHRTASDMLHYTGRFKIRRMVQARLFRKSNPDAHYANSIYKFLKERAVRNHQNVDFFSADAKCKVPVGEPGYPIATVTREKKVIVGNNEKFHVADHDFTKLSLIPDAYLLHEIPESRDDLTAEESCDDIESGEKSRSGEWFTGQVFYGFKSMVSEGSTSMRCAAELGELMIEQFETIPPYLYVYSDGGPERKTDNLSV